jgi:hypothetical protein
MNPAVSWQPPKQEIPLSILQLLNSCLLVPESTDAELHEVDLFREPGHHKQVNGQ